MKYGPHCAVNAINTIQSQLDNLVNLVNLEILVNLVNLVNGESGDIQSKNLYCKIWTFKYGFFSMKMIQKGL